MVPYYVLGYVVIVVGLLILFGAVLGKKEPEQFRNVDQHREERRKELDRLRAANRAAWTRDLSERKD